MGKRTYEIDSVAMALLYLNEYANAGMVAYDKALKFDEIINENLDKMDSSFMLKTRLKPENRLYFTTLDENRDLYAIINPSANLEDAFSWHIACLPVDVMKASLEPNALDAIGLEYVDGKITIKESGKQLKKTNR